MIWLTWKLLTLPIRVVLGSVKLVFRTIRFVGVGRILAFAAGVGTGLSVAQVPGREFRARVAQGQQTLASGGGDLAATVRYELENSPRTWHLPQPRVSVDAGRVTLTGTVPHDEARADLVRTTGAIAGVRAVDDQLVVDGRPQPDEATDPDDPAEGTDA